MEPLNYTSLHTFLVFAIEPIFRTAHRYSMFDLQFNP